MTDERPDLIAELRRLGRQLGETFETAWNSAERQRAQADLREGARVFAEEIEKAARRVRVADRGEIATRARKASAEGLRWLSEELADLAARFTPAEPEEPPADPDEPATG